MYIDQDIRSVKGSMTLFMVLYILNDNGPCFSPNLKMDNGPSLFELIHSLLKDIVDMGSCMDRIANGYSTYNVKNIYKKIK